MITFGLVHGAWHGAWCWDLVIEELAARGHRAVAVDLPIDDPDAGVAEYADVVLGALKNARDVVLVGHSTAGLTIPVVATQLQERGRPPRRLVLVAPLLPMPGRSHDELRRVEPDQLMPGLNAGQITQDDGSTAWQKQAAIATMYPDAPANVAQWAAQRLRPQHHRVLAEVTPLRAWPQVEMTVIACASDSVVNPEWVRRSAPVRLGVVARVLPGDHAPFLARPGELTDLMVA